MESVRAKALPVLAVLVAASLAIASATFGQGPEIGFPPQVEMTYDSRPAPIPESSEGRVPVSFRFSTSISLDDDSHPPAATGLRLEFTPQFGLSLAGLPTCPRASFGPRSSRSPCEEMRFATGRSSWEVAFPGQEPVQVEGRTIAYKIGPRKMAFWTFLPAPVAAEVLIPVEITRLSGKTIYRLRAAASIPKVAGGNASLLRLGLHFRKGVFSLACTQGRFQSRLTGDFADGTRTSVALLRTC